MSVTAAKDFSVAKDNLSRQLNTIANEANTNRMLSVSSLTTELNQVLQQTVLLC